MAAARSNGRPPGRKTHTARPSTPTDELWVAVKRIERAAADMPRLVEELRAEVQTLREQVKKANAVIITLVRQVEPTDYETLNQQSHKFNKT